jgi:predicted DsbA family dithiol-disulfide isomerase
MNEIIMFHGASCPHCHHMMPIVDKLIENSFEIEKKEVWENKENAKEMRKFKDIITSACEDGLGVPAFVNVKKNKAICGEYTYEELKKWIEE